MVISDYYQTLDRKARIAFREFVLNRTKISMPTFYVKIAKGTFTPSETFYINHLIKEFKDVRKG